MNPGQMALQLRHLLRAVAWPTGDADPVFGQRGVAVFAGTPSEEQMPPAFPWCMVILGQGSHDTDDPDLIEQSYTILVAADVTGDPLGEFAVIGGASRNLGRSVGRGVLELAERARSAVERLTGVDGAPIQVSASSTASPVALGRGRHLAMHEFTVTALVTSALDYSAPQFIAHSDTTNAWTWDGEHCSNRFDFMQYRLVRKDGDSPSSTPEDGTTLYTGTAAEYVGALQPGNTYTAFADYDGRGRGSVEGSSQPEVGSYLVT